MAHKDCRNHIPIMGFVHMSHGLVLWVRPDGYRIPIGIVDGLAFCLLSPYLPALDFCNSPVFQATAGSKIHFKIGEKIQFIKLNISIWKKLQKSSAGR